MARLLQVDTVLSHLPGRIATGVLPRMHEAASSARSRIHSLLLSG